MEVGCIDESISDSESEYENQEDVTGVIRKSVWPWLRALAAVSMEQQFFAQAIPDIESWPQENEARLVTRDGFGQHRGFSFAKANEYDIATLHQCIAQDKVARQSRFLEIADFLEAIPTASVQASQASPSVARVHTPSVTKRHQASPSVASVTKRVASKRRKGAETQ